MSKKVELKNAEAKKNYGSINGVKKVIAENPDRSPENSRYGKLPTPMIKVIIVMIDVILKEQTEN